MTDRNVPRTTAPFQDRLWPKVNKLGPIPDYAPDLGPCWLWTGKTSDKGYGRLVVSDNGAAAAHRLVYELLVGPIPEGLDSDHLCRVRHCVNPAHLEPVTGRENTMRSPIAPAAVNARKTHCSQNHPYDEANTYLWHGERLCLICKRNKDRLGQQRLRDRRKMEMSA